MNAATPPEPPADSIEAPDSAADDTVIEDVLVEEISIDGMCGVY